MSDSLIALKDVKSSLGLLDNVNQLVAGTNITLSPTNGIGVVTVNAPATLPSGLLVNPSPTPAGGYDTYAVNIAGVTANSVVTAQMQVMTAADYANGTVIYTVQPTNTGGGGIIITTKTRVNPLTISWAVLKF